MTQPSPSALMVSTSPFLSCPRLDFKGENLKQILLPTHIRGEQLICVMVPDFSLLSCRACLVPCLQLLTAVFRLVFANSPTDSRLGSTLSKVLLPDPSPSQHCGMNIHLNTYLHCLIFNKRRQTLKNSDPVLYTRFILAALPLNMKLTLIRLF
jgi:hypothetical protein